MAYVLQYSYLGAGVYVTDPVALTVKTDGVFGPIGAGKYLRLIGYKISPARNNVAGARFFVRMRFSAAGGYFASHVMAGGADGNPEAGSGWVFFPEPGLFDVSQLNTAGVEIASQCTVASQSFFFDMLYSIETTL